MTTLPPLDARGVRVDAFMWDEENEEHLAERHPEIDPGDVDSVLGQPRAYKENTQGRSGILVIGMDRKNRLLVIPSDPTAVAGLYRPRTAHEAQAEWQRKAYEAVLVAEESGENND